MTNIKPRRVHQIEESPVPNTVPEPAREPAQPERVPQEQPA